MSLLERKVRVGVSKLDWKQVPDSGFSDWECPMDECATSMAWWGQQTTTYQTHCLEASSRQWVQRLRMSDGRVCYVDGVVWSADDDVPNPLSGSKFQTVGSATENVRRTSVLRRWRGVVSRRRRAERSRWRLVMSETGTQQSTRYCDTSVWRHRWTVTPSLYRAWWDWNAAIYQILWHFGVKTSVNCITKLVPGLICHIKPVRYKSACKVCDSPPSYFFFHESGTSHGGWTERTADRQASHVSGKITRWG